MRVVCAVGGRAEGEAIEAALKAAIPDCLVSFPGSIAEVERLHAENLADVIVTDFSFQGGGLADWLVLWPLPAVLIADPGDSSERLGQSLREESSLLIERRKDGGHVERLPLLVRKALGIRESVNRQNLHLRITERRYMDLLQAIPDIVYSLDGDGHFTYLNDAARVLGFEPAHLIGKHFSEILDPVDVGSVSRDRVLRTMRGIETGDEKAPKLFDERRTGQRMTRNLELKLRFSGEESRYGAVFSYGEVSSSGFDWPEFEGRGIGTVGIIRDITQRKRHERELEELLAQRERLLSEIHHRVRNNLQLVCSLMHIEESSSDGPRDRGAFVRARAQVEAMAFVYELFRGPGSQEQVEMGDVVTKLVDNLAEIYDAQGKGLSVLADASGLVLDLDSAVGVSLLANELVTESLGRRYCPGRGKIALSIGAEGGDCRLELRDDSDNEGGVGTASELVEALASQLKGDLSVAPGESGRGRRVGFRFPRPDPEFGS